MSTTETSRTPRATESREQTKRPASWEPADLLPTPDPRPGLDFQYVRLSARNELDNVTFSQSLRNGWEPVQASDYPELRIMSDHNSRFPDGIVLGGLVLCARPSEIGEQIREHAQKLSEERMKAVDETYFRDNNSAMPKFVEKRTSVSFGRERK